jgi:gliding motility-associated-like protein
MKRNNSSPTFKEWPPVYICANEPLNFDHSAFDIDGDSLVYKLCTPIQGATFAKPKPQPPNPPPYDEVIFIEPTYSLDNLLGFGIPLKVNQLSGLMTVTPELLGQYVVGVCVEEYDRETGELLSVVRRDFQYNVINCEPLRASFEAPDAICDDFTVQFDNRTPAADDFIWYFNAPDKTFTSTERDPSFTFPDTGIFTVELIVEPNTVCEERFTKDIYVQRNSLAASFRVDVLECADSAYLFLVDQSIDTIGTVDTWEWLIQPDGEAAFTVNGQFPVIQLPINSTGTIQLTATSVNGCRSTSLMDYEAPGINLKSYLEDTLSACAGDSLFLNPNTPPDIQLNYAWTGPGLSDATSVNPGILVTEGTTTYQLTISGPDNSCLIQHTLTVIGGSNPGLDFNAFSNCAGLNYQFENTSTNSSTIQWLVGGLNTPLFTSTEESFDFTFPEAGTYDVYLIGMAGCIDTLIKRITVLPDGNLGADFRVEYDECASNSVEVRFVEQSTATDSIVKWEWQLADGRSSQLASPIFTFTESDSLEVALVIESIGGCRDSITKTIQINLLEDILARLPDTIGLCAGLGQQLLPENDGKYIYQWSPTTGLSDANVPNPVFSEIGIYTVEISLPGSATCRVEKQIVAALPANINLNIDGGGVSCDPSVNLTANTSIDTKVNWFLNGDLLVENSPDFIANIPGANTYTVIAIDQFNCTDTATVGVNLIGVNVDLPDQIAACEGEAIQATIANLNENDQLTYLWSPADLITAGQGTGSVTINAPIGINKVFVEIENQANCVLIDSVEVVVVDPDQVLSFTKEPFCDGLTVQFTNTSQNAFGFAWDFGDPNNPGASSTEASPSYTYSQLGTYTATLSIQYDVSCRDSISMTFTLDDSTAFAADFAVELLACQTGAATFKFTDLTDGGNPNLNYEYTFADGTIITEPNFEIIINKYGPQDVRLRVSSEEGCEDTITKTINFPVVELDLPETLGYCDPGGLILNPNGIADYDYQWAALPGISDLTAVSPQVTPTTTTTYVVTVTATGFDQCVVIDSVTVVIPDSLLVLGLPDEIKTCGAATLSTNVQGAESLTWEDGEGNIIGTGASVEVEPAQTATYYLRAVDQYGCEVLDSVKVINQAVNVQVQPGTEINVCEEQEVLINIENLDENDNLTYQWLPAALILAGEDTAMPTLNLGGQGTYDLTVIVGNQFACADTIQITVNVGDLMSGLPDQVLVCGEEMKALSPGANPKLTYLWSPATGLDDPTSSNPIFSGTINTTYIVMVSDPLGGPDCQATDTVEVIIGNAVEIITEAAPDTACVGLDLTLEANAAAGTISWYAGEDFTDLNTNNNQLNITIARGENIYYAIVNEVGGCSDTARFSILGIEIEDLGLMSPLQGCIGETFNLLPDANPSFTYQWSPANLLEDATVANPRTIALEQDVTFQVTVTLPEAGCTLEGEVLVDVKDDIILEITNDTTTCPQTMLTLEAQVESGATLSWLDADGNVLGQTNTLQVSVDTNDVVITALAIDSEGCEQRQDVSITINSLDAGLETPVEVCAGIPTEINPQGNDAYTYLWSPVEGLDLSNPWNPVVTLDSSQTFMVTVTDPQSTCVLETSVEVVVLENITIVSTTNDTTVCTADVLTLSAVTNRPTTLEWFSDEAMTMSIGTGDSIQVTPAEGTNLYYVKTADDRCTDENDRAVIEVIRGNAVEIIAAAAPDTACVGLDLTLEANAAAGTISWYAGEDFTDLNTNNNQLNITIARGENIYYAIVNEVGGCSDTARFSILGIEIEDLGLMSPLQGCIGDVFDLFPGANTGFTYLWSPANLLEDATVANPRTVALEQDVTFQVTVTLPEAGCTLEGEVLVDVKDDIITEISEDITTCPQTTVTIQAQTELGATLSWLDADGNLLGQADTLLVQVDTSDLVITAVAVDSTGCEQRVEVKINIDGLENPGLDSPLEICEGIPTAINPGANANYEYQWSPVEGLDLSDPRNPVATLDTSQTFAVTVTDMASGCTLVTNVEVIVIENISIVLTSNDTMICEPAELTLIAMTNIPTTLKWFADAAMTMPIGTGENIQVVPVEGVNLYYVKTGDERCIDQNDVDTVKVEVIDFSMVAPDTLIEPCKGEVLALNPRGDNRFSYEWMPAEGLSDPNSPNPSITAQMNQVYMVTITSPDGMCSITRDVEVRLNAPINIDAGMDTILCTTGTFKLRATGDNPQNVMWSNDPSFVDILSMDAELEIDLVDGGQYYYVKADNGQCPVEIDSIFVGSGLIDATLDDMILVCDESQGAVLTVQNNKPLQNLEYLWMPDQDFADPTMGPSATLNPGVDGAVSVLLENQFGCMLELSSTVEIQDIGNATIEASETTVKAGNPVQLTVVNCAECEYSWSPPETINNPNAGSVMASPLETTTYMVTVTKGDCERVLSITIETTGELCSADNIFIPRAFTPNGDNQNDVLYVRSNVIDTYQLIIYNRWGQEVFDSGLTSDLNRGWDGTFRGRDLPPDVYGYLIEATCVGGGDIILRGNVTLLR